tara:strand:+ start:331 stop:639 length:309 start_codon:yes stop_codon:yes gene_type:complete
MIHSNSVAAYDENEREQMFSKRECEIIRAFERFGARTDRQILALLGYTDPNAVRPRITELINKGVLEQTDDKVCPVTEKRVRICNLAPKSTGGFLPGFGGQQ